MKNIDYQRLKKITLLTLLIFVSNTNWGQTVVGKLFDNVRGQSFIIYDNFFMVQEGNPANFGTMVRDPSGYMFTMLPAVNPYLNAFFVDWGNNLVEMDRFRGTHVIGYCQCPPPPLNPYANIYKQPQLNANVGIQLPNGGFRPLPSAIIDVNNPYGKIMITGESEALQCYNQSLSSDGVLDREKFNLCMVGKFAGAKEQAIFNCVRNAKSPEEQTLCLMETLGGSAEKRVAHKLMECYQQYGDNFSNYPLCMAGSATNDPELQRIFACMEQQSRTGEVTLFGTAICYGASQFNLNPETQIVVECAMASGGDPYVFAGCAGGQLLARELDKCFTNGVGVEGGCFGPNNDIIKALDAAGDALVAQFGENNDVVKNWRNAVRDLTLGPGPNNDAVKTFKNVGNEVGKAANNVGKAIKKGVPRITF